MAAGRYHIIIDLKEVPEKVLTDKDGLVAFLTQFPPIIEMHVLHPPVVVEGIPENPGLTGFVLIDFSHISVHTFTKHQEVLVDIFSCKSYDQEAAIEATLKYFPVPRSLAHIQQVFWG